MLWWLRTHNLSFSVAEIIESAGDFRTKLLVNIMARNLEAIGTNIENT